MKNVHIYKFEPVYDRFDMFDIPHTYTVAAESIQKAITAIEEKCGVEVSEKYKITEITEEATAIIVDVGYMETDLWIVQ